MKEKKAINKSEVCLRCEEDLTDEYDVTAVCDECSAEGCTRCLEDGLCDECFAEAQEDDDE